MYVREWGVREREGERESKIEMKTHEQMRKENLTKHYEPTLPKHA